MEKHFQLTDLELENQFRDGSLDPLLLSHEAHLRLAWIHLTNYGVERACRNLCDQILQFDRIHGDGTKFHRTLTVAGVKAIDHLRQGSEAGNFTDFIREFPRLKNNFRELINSHYSRDILSLERARREYLEPDLLPFS